MPLMTCPNETMFLTAHPRLVRLPRRKSVPGDIPAAPRGGVLAEALARLSQTNSSQDTATPAVPGSVKVRLSVPAVAESQSEPHDIARAVCGRSTRNEPAAPITAAPVQRRSRDRDRRAFPRRPSACTVTVCRREPDEKLTPQRLDWLLHAGRVRGELNDISMSGAAFTVAEKYSADDTVFLRLSQRQSGTTLDTAATIVSAKPADDGRWNVHCQFKQPLTLDQVQKFGQQLFVSAVV